MTIFDKNDQAISPVYCLKSFAKLNLCFSITGKREEDGYHLIDSLFSYLNLSDIITIQQNALGTTNFKVLGQYTEHLMDSDKIRHNTILKAIQKMSELYGIDTNFDILLDKRIPIASGMGGGSSNAATMIKFLDSFFDLNLSRKELSSVAISIGADVPFFLQDKMAICKGIGEIVIQIDNVEKMFGVIVICGKKSSTGHMYDMFANQVKKYKKSNLVIDKNKVLEKDHIVDIIRNNGNDLFKIASELNPKIQEVIEYLDNSKLSIVSGMSGAGPTCFSICESEYNANRLAFETKLYFKHCSAIPIQILPSVTSDTVLPSLQPCYGAIFRAKYY